MNRPIASSANILLHAGAPGFTRVVFGCFVMAAVLFSGAVCCQAKEKNIIKFGRDLAIEHGRTVRGAASVVGNVSVDGNVEDDVVAVGGSVVLWPNAVVGGNVVSVGGVIDKRKGARVEGNVVEVNIPILSFLAESVPQGRLKELAWVLRLSSFIGFLALSLVTVALVPRPIQLISLAIEKTPINVISRSIQGLLFIVPLAVILTMSVAGILLIPLEVIVVTALTLFGYIALARLIGQKIWELLKQPGASMLFETTLGITIVTFLGYVPVAGWIVKAVVALLGLGGVLAVIFDRKKQNAT